MGGRHTRVLSRSMISQPINRSTVKWSQRELPKDRVILFGGRLSTKACLLACLPANNHISFMCIRAKLRNHHALTFAIDQLNRFVEYYGNWYLCARTIAPAIHPSNGEYLCNWSGVGLLSNSSATAATSNYQCNSLCCTWQLPRNSECYVAQARIISNVAQPLMLWREGLSFCETLQFCRSDSGMQLKVRVFNYMRLASIGSPIHD